MFSEKEAQTMNPFEKTTIGGIELKNRFALAPMTTYSGNPDLTPSDEEIHYLSLRSHGPAMIISPAIAVNEQAQAFTNQMSLMDDGKILPMKCLVDSIKAKGGVPIAQLHHGGRMNDPECHANHDNIVAPSAVKALYGNKVTPRPMRLDEIEYTVADFKAATLRAIKAGYQGIELHGANTYLLQQFFSPHSNKRDDIYGGSFDNRMNFIKQVIDETLKVIKTHAPEKFILGYRFSPEEIEEDGITMEMTLKLIAYLKTKPFDYLHASLRHYKQSSLRDEKDETLLVDKIQSVLNHEIPLIGAGGVDTKEKAEEALNAGFDYIAVGFSVLADPNAIDQMQQGKLPSKAIDASTLPTNLLKRLEKYKDRLEKDGFTFYNLP